MIMTFRNWLATAAVATSFTTTVLTSPASAAPLVSPGAPVNSGAGSCSQAFAGYVTLNDGACIPIMVTAGHCLNQGNPVTVPTQNGQVHVGHADKVHPPLGFEDIHDPFPQDIISYATSPDWATVRLAPGTEMSRWAQSTDLLGLSSSAPRLLTGIRDYRDLGYNQFSTDNFGQPICKDGSTSGRTCGVQLFRSRDMVMHTPMSLPGDSGSIVYDPNNGEVIGITSGDLAHVVGLTQTADAALQDAYGIPDGQVNQRFRLEAEHLLGCGG